MSIYRQKYMCVSKSNSLSLISCTCLVLTQDLIIQFACFRPNTSSKRTHKLCKHFYPYQTPALLPLKIRYLNVFDSQKRLSVCHFLFQYSFQQADHLFVITLLMKDKAKQNNVVLTLKFNLTACSPVKCHVFNNLTADIKKDQNFPHASSNTLSTMLYYLSQPNTKNPSEQ